MVKKYVAFAPGHKWGQAPFILFREMNKKGRTDS